MYYFIGGSGGPGLIDCLMCNPEQVVVGDFSLITLKAKGGIATIWFIKTSERERKRVTLKLLVVLKSYMDNC